MLHKEMKVLEIKRYPNRKLYDPSKSRYISLEHILKLALDGRDFKVINTKDGADITASTLFMAMSGAVLPSTIAGPEAIKIAQDYRYLFEQTQATDGLPFSMSLSGADSEK